MGRIAEVLITSGIPGAGKSTWLRKNTNPYMTEIFSADHFFMDSQGQYHFDGSKLSEAHSECLRAYLERLRELAETEISTCPIVLAVDNTNICAWEIAPYYSLAQAYSVPVRILRFITDPSSAYMRNIHGVEKEKVMKMAERLQNATLPSFWNIEEIRDWN